MEIRFHSTSSLSLAHTLSQSFYPSSALLCSLSFYPPHLLFLLLYTVSSLSFYLYISLSFYPPHLLFLLLYKVSSLSLYRYIFLSFYPPPLFSLSFFLFISSSALLSIFPFSVPIHLFPYLFFSFPFRFLELTSTFIYIPLSLSLFLSLYIFIRLSLYLPTCFLSSSLSLFSYYLSSFSTFPFIFRLAFPLSYLNLPFLDSHSLFPPSSDHWLSSVFISILLFCLASLYLFFLPFFISISDIPQLFCW